MIHCTLFVKFEVNFQAKINIQTNDNFCLMVSALLVPTMSRVVEHWFYFGEFGKDQNERLSKSCCTVQTCLRNIQSDLLKCWVNKNRFYEKLNWSEHSLWLIAIDALKIAETRMSHLIWMWLRLNIFNENSEAIHYDIYNRELRTTDERVTTEVKRKEWIATNSCTKQLIEEVNKSVWSCP